MLHPQFKEIFREGSKTYYNSSYFFPSKVRDQVFVLYAFVRTADNLVDSIPSQAQEFKDFRNSWNQAKKTGKSNNLIIQEFLNLSKELNFEDEWTEAFLDSMQMDLDNKKYNTLADIEKYIYGSAEVIGLYMAKIMGLQSESLSGAMKLGKAMQFINFIRDIAEDNVLGRSYFPLEDFKKCNLESLDINYIFNHTKEFEQFIHLQLSRYQEWQNEAEKSFKFIPKRYLIPIKTASEMYKWTGLEIAKNPIKVLSNKIKPRRYNIFWTAFKQLVAS